MANCVLLSGAGILARDSKIGRGRSDCSCVIRRTNRGTKAANLIFNTRFGTFPVSLALNPVRELKATKRRVFPFQQSPILNRDSGLETIHNSVTLDPN